MIGFVWWSYLYYRSISLFSVVGWGEGRGVGRGSFGGVGE